MALRARNLVKFAGAAVATVAGGYVLVVSNRDLELKVDAWLFDKILSSYNEVASVKKSVHLAPLRHTPCLSGDETVKARGKFRLVDVGSGTGVNAPFYPREAVVTGVDPNVQFEPYFRQRMAQSLVEVDKCITEKGENMKDIPSNSMDAAVTTMTLCHADDELKFTTEIKRVLAPGAKYYFWEHIHPFHDGSCGHGHGHAGHSHGHKHGKDHGADRSLNRNIRFISKLLFSGLGGGHAGHHPGSHEREAKAMEELMKNAGFSDVTMSVFYLKDEVPPEEVETFSWFTKKCFDMYKDKAHVRGVATK